jgi:hypothetical protein
MRSLLSLCCPCHHHAVLATIMQPLSPSCRPCCRQAAPATIMRPLLPSSGASATLNHCNPFSWPNLFSCGAATSSQWPLPPSCGPCCHQGGPCCHQGAPCHHHTGPAAIMRPLPSSSFFGRPASPLLLFPQPRSQLPCLFVCRRLWGGPLQRPGIYHCQQWLIPGCLKGTVQRDLRGGLTLHHSIGLALRMSHGPVFEILFSRHLVFFANPFSGI